MRAADGRLRVLTWHVHGSYLWYLSHVPVTWYVPTRSGRPEGYGGRAGAFPWPDNVVEVPADEVGSLELDVVLTQSHRNWHEDRRRLLGPAQLELPAVHLEHDPPRASPTDTRHPVDDERVLVVHVTHFNDLMWDCGRTPTVVVEHDDTVEVADLGHHGPYRVLRRSPVGEVDGAVCHGSLGRPPVQHDRRATTRGDRADHGCAQAGRAAGHEDAERGGEDVGHGHRATPSARLEDVGLGPSQPLGRLVRLGLVEVVPEQRRAG